MLNFKIVKFLYLCCLLAVSICSFTVSGQSSKLEYSSTVDKGVADLANYRYLELPNGLKVLLISDPRVHLATASISVGVGYFDDPATQAGSAHLLEHMLSKGSKEFPGAATYKQFLANHGGASNASTSSQHTNYYFYISPSNFDEALARFSAQFKTPLLLESMIDKEKNAVNAEFKLKLKDTFRRKREVTRLTINPLHPYRKFSTGNLDTLRDDKSITLHQTITSLFERFYVANNMTLVLQSKHPLIYLEKLTRKHFEKLKFSDKFEEHRLSNQLPEPLTSDQKTKLILIKTIANKRRITMSFKVDSALSVNGRSKAAYLKWLIESETQNGLKNHLFELELIHDLEVEYFKLDRAHDFFEIEFRLTKRGIEKADKIISRTMSYIEFVKKEAINQNQYSIFKELKDLAFEQNERPHSRQGIRTLANRMFSVSPKDILTHTGKVTQFDKAAIEQFLNKLSPENLSVTVLSKKFGLKNIEPIYQTEYAIRNLRWEKETENYENFSLPTRSKFMGTSLSKKSPQVKFDYVEDERPSAFTHIRTSENSSAFRSTTVSFSSPIIKALDQSTKNWVLLELMLSRFDEQLETLRRQAKDALINLYLTEESDGFSLTVSSYQDNHTDLLALAVSTILNQSLSDNLVNSSYTLLKSGYRANQSERLREKVSRKLRETIGLRPSNTKALHQLEKILEKHYQRFVARFFGSSNTSVLFYGDISKDSQEEIGQLLVTSHSLNLNQKPVAETPLHKQITNRFLVKAGQNSYDFEHPDHAIREVRILKEQTPESVAKLLLLGHLIKAPFFRQLRTQKQLGYTVSAATKNIRGVEYLNYYVQSPETPSDKILQHVYSFNKDFIASLSSLSDIEFKQRKSDMLSKMRARTQTSEQKFVLLKRHHNWGFEQEFNQQVLTKIEDISLSQFVAFSEEILNEKYPHKITIMTK